MNTELNIITYDKRAHQDLKTREIEKFFEQGLRDKVDYNYTYTKADGHKLVFNGLLRYIIPNTDDKQHELFKLPITAGNSEIDRDELNFMINDWIHSISVTHILEKDRPQSRFNWLLGTYARYKRGTGSVANAIVTNFPSLLNYDDDDIFDTLMLVTGEKYFEIDMTDGNLFSGSIIDGAVIRFWSHTEKMSNIISNLMGKGYSSCHVTQHFNQPHTFHYATELTMLNHILAKGLENMGLYVRQQSGELQLGDRPSEQLYLIGSSEKARRMNAVLSLFPAEIVNSTVSISNVADLLAVSDMYYRHADKARRKRYMQCYNDTSRLYVSKSQYIAINTIPGRIHTQPLIGFMDTDDRDVLMVGSGVQLPVKWYLRNGLGFDYDYEPISTRKVNSSQIRMGISTVDDSTKENLMGVVSMYGNVDEITPEALEAMAIDSAELYVKPVNENILMLNNTFRAWELMRNKLLTEITKEFNDVAIAAYSLSHLLLCMLYSNKFNIVGGKLMLQEDHVLKLRRINNSTIKMIAIYVDILILHARKDLPQLRMLPNETVIFLGAEEEMTVDIVNEFNGFQCAKGLGDRALGKHTRMTLPLPHDVHYSANYVISDIDQSFERYPDHNLMLNETLSMLKSCINIADCGFFKLNFPSTYVVSRCFAVLKEKLGKKGLFCSVARLATQNPFTTEVFIKYYTVPANSLSKYITTETSYTSRLRTQRSKASYGDLPVITHVIPIIKDLSDFQSRLTIVNCEVDMLNVDKAMSLLGHMASKALTFRIDEQSDSVIISAKLDQNRLVYLMRSVTKSTRSLYKNYIPRGLGLSSKSVHQYLFSDIGWNTTFKIATYHAIRKDLEALKVTNPVIDIGGRDLNGLWIAPVNKTYTVIDPAMEQFADLNADIHIITEQFNFDDPVIKENTTYLCIFVLMTEVDGSPVLGPKQIERIQKLVIAANQADGATCYFNFYESSMKLLMNRNISEDVTFSDDYNNVTLGSYIPVPMLNLDDVLKVAPGITKINVSLSDLASVSLFSGSRIGCVGSICFDVCFSGIPLFRC